MLVKTDLLNGEVYQADIQDIKIKISNSPLTATNDEDEMDGNDADAGNDDDDDNSTDDSIKLDQRSNEILIEMKTLHEQFLNVREDLYQSRMLKLELDELAFKCGRYEKYNKLIRNLDDEKLERCSKAVELRENKLKCIQHKYLAEKTAAECDLKEAQENAYDSHHKDLIRQRRNLMWKRWYEKKKMKQTEEREGKRKN